MALKTGKVIRNKSVQHDVKIYMFSLPLQFSFSHRFNPSNKHIKPHFTNNPAIFVLWDLLLHAKFNREVIDTIINRTESDVTYASFECERHHHINSKPVNLSLKGGTNDRSIHTFLTFTMVLTVLNN